MNIRTYETKDETGWLRCRVLSFLDTACFDNVLRKKETYENSSIELVAEEDNQIVGLIDIEYEKEPKTVCSHTSIISGMIWHIAVHPDYQRKGIASVLLNESIKILRTKNINRLEAWTRDDKWVQKWYESQNFKRKNTYYHVFIENNTEIIHSKMSNIRPVTTFAHYIGDNIDELKQGVNRVHECNMYERMINE